MADMNRYSTVVVWAKVTLPLIALALLSTMFLFSRTPDPDAALPFADVDIEQLVQEQRLSQPRFAGTLDDGREVTLIADSAAPQPTDPNHILLVNVEAELALAPTDQLVLHADDGDIHLSQQTVDLQGNVQADTTQGYRLLSDRIRIAMDSMRITSPGPVTLSGNGMTLEAGSMDLTGQEGDGFLSFTGGVRLLYEQQE
ncbi:MAG: LPS export ABC transporter periplasmic protein LptC [Roseicyclus sp.]